MRRNKPCTTQSNVLQEKNKDMPTLNKLFLTKIILRMTNMTEQKADFVPFSQNIMRGYLGMSNTLVNSGQNMNWNLKNIMIL